MRTLFVRTHSRHLPHSQSMPARFTVWKRVGQILGQIGMIAFFVVVVGVVLPLMPIPKFYQLFVVESGSMQPSIPVGSLVISHPQTSYRTGQVVTYRDQARPKVTITHRIIRFNGLDAVTQGDANDAPDLQPVPSKNIVGRVLFHLPYFGYVISFTKTVPGLILLVIIPATVIVWEELKKLNAEWHTTGKRKTTSTTTSRRTPRIRVVGQPTMFDVRPPIPEKNSHSAGIKWFILLTIVSVSAFSAQAVFNDSATSASTFATTAWNQPHIIISEVCRDRDHGHDHDGNQNDPPYDTWIELYNPTDQPQNLHGWTIGKNHQTFTLDGHESIPAHGYSLLSRLV